MNYSDRIVHAEDEFLSENMKESSRSRSHDLNTVDIERNTVQTPIDNHTPSKKSINQHKKTFPGVPETDLSRGVIGWDGQDDPQMPLNFSLRRKWALLSLVSLITFISPLASSIFAPAVAFLNADFGNTNDILASFCVSIFVLGYAFGPLVLSPLSEIFGRRPILSTANFVFVVFQIGCALAPNMGSLIAFRFFAGVGGSGCLTLGAGVISDLFTVEERGLATALWSLGPLFGPVIGPIAGGFIAQRAGWRWVFWVLLIASATFATGVEIFNRETNARVIIKRKTRRLAKELRRDDLRSCYADEASPISDVAIIIHGIMRPLKLLFLSPIVILLSFYMAVVYGLLYLLFTTITTVFTTKYGWSSEITGLAYLGLAVGFFLGTAVVAKTSDSTVARLTKANNGTFEPEMRLPAMVFFASFVPISFFWYGWSTDKGVHWIVPIIGMAPFGFGTMGIFIPIQAYLIDCFPDYAASAAAALTPLRSIFGALLPLAGPPMYEKLGLGWGNSLLGFIAVALIPVPAVIYKFGGRIRRDHPLKL